MSRVTLIAAVAANGVIGAGGKVPWQIHADMVRFRLLTTGHTVLMGRKTWESLPDAYRPLPGRRNLVASRNSEYQAPGAEVVLSVYDAVEDCHAKGQDCWVIGGRQIYRDALDMDLVDAMELTMVHDVPEGDVLFPRYRQENWVQDNKRSGLDSDLGLRYDFVSLVRRK